MRRSDEGRLGHLRVVLVGTGTGVGKTHVACALLAWCSTRAEVVGLKPIETGIAVVGAAQSGGPRGGRDTRLSERPPDGRRLRAIEASDQERLNEAARMFHVKQRASGGRRAGPARRGHAAPMFHVKHPGGRGHEPALTRSGPLTSLYAFHEPVSPHLAAREAGARIDIGLIERWVGDHEAPITLIETAGGLFSPLGCGATNFDLARALRPDAVLLVAPDRLGVLHDVTTTLALAAARGGLPLGVVLSAPAKKDASTGRNEAEMIALGIARPIARFPRTHANAPTSAEQAARVMAWIPHAATRALR